MIKKITCVFAAIFLAVVLSQDAYGTDDVIQNKTENYGKTMLHNITVNDTTYVVQSISDVGSTVHDIELDIESKTLLVSLEPTLNTKGVTIITLMLDNNMLSGTITVMYDDQLAKFKNDYLYTKTKTKTIFLMKLPSSTEKISITGTQVVPEFPFHVLVIAALTFSVLLGIGNFARKINYIK